MRSLPVKAEVVHNPHVIASNSWRQALQCGRPGGEHLTGLDPEMKGSGLPYKGVEIEEDSGLTRVISDQGSA